MSCSRDPCTHIADITTFENWHKGRKYYGVWMYRFDDASLISLLSQLATSISIALTTLPIHNFHITLFASGFLSLSKNYDDDISFTTLQRQINVLKTCSLAAPHFVITGLTANAYNVYLTLTETSDVTTQLRHKLAATQREIPYTPYVLHMTLGNYWKKHTLAHVITTLSTLPLPTFPIILPSCWLEFVALKATIPIRPDIGLCHDHFITLYRDKRV
ncbi:MAG: hypothetical protein J6P29_05315 [Acetobacter sp.]|nr:hypothetical protein [Acetobacter sp.]